MATAAQKAQKEANARFWACRDEEITHVRVGAKRGQPARIELIGMVSHLHGKECTCCPKRTTTTRQQASM